MTTATSTVKFKYFRSTISTWDELFAQAAEFAAQIGRERLVGISQSQWGADAVVTVWYWSDDDA